MYVMALLALKQYWLSMTFSLAMVSVSLLKRTLLTTLQVIENMVIPSNRTNQTSHPCYLDRVMMMMLQRSCGNLPCSQQQTRRS